MTLLRGLAIEDLTKPELTGNWEYQLAEMEHGRLKRDAFMAEIAKMAERIVRKAKEYDRDTIPGDYATLATPCPNCGGVVKENYRRFACTGAERRGRRLRLLHHQDPGRPRLRGGRGRRLPARQEDRPAGGLPLQGRLALHGRAEAGARRRDRNWKLEFDFGDDAKAAEGDGEPVDFSARPAWAPAPSARAMSTSTARNYVCEHAVGAPVTCDFKSGKIILQQPVPPEEMTSCWPPARPAAGELRLQQDAAQVQGLPDLTTRRKARWSSSSSRVSPIVRTGGRRSQRGRPQTKTLRGGAALPIGCRGRLAAPTANRPVGQADLRRRAVAPAASRPSITRP
jgi:hypothetical protein